MLSTPDCGWSTFSLGKNYWSCYVIFEDDGPAPTCEGVNHLHVNMIEFCKQLYADISKDLDVWVHWDDDQLEFSLDEGDDDGIAKRLEERRELISGKLERLNALIQENEGCFGPNCCFF